MSFPAGESRVESRGGAVGRWGTGVVVDPFLGTGTTAVACRLLGRRFVGCDIDGEMVKIARHRVSSEWCLKNGAASVHP